MKNQLLLFLLFNSLTLICFSQNLNTFKKLLGKELKTNAFYTKPLIVDFNCDNKKDFAVILQDKKIKDYVTLLVIYSSKDSLIKQDLGVLSDTMDLRLDYANAQKKMAGSNVIYKCNSIFIGSNEYEYLFQYNSQANRFRKIYEHHIGP